MTKKEQIVDLLGFIYTEMCSFTDQLNPQEREQVGEVDCWSQRDVIAHLAEEHRWVAERLAQGPGVEFPGRGEDFDQINRDIWNAYRDKPIREILRILEDSQQSLLQSLEMLSDDDLNQPGRFPLTGERPLWRYLTGLVVMHPISHLCQQYAEHGSISEAKRLSDEVTRLMIALDEELEPTAIYNRACISALIGEKEAALKDLELSLRQNPGLIEWAQQDSDLACLHGTPRI